MPPSPTPDPLYVAFQQALAGRYSIVRELGRGGMGVVYLAHEVHLDRLVAIKLLPPALAERPALRERFLREAQLAARLSHPHIIPIHAVHDAAGFVYFVMAYVDGETLAQRVQARGPLSAGDATRVLREVAWALGHAHAQGLVHRDVKPDNVLLEAGSGRAVVADFGIAAVTSDAVRVGAESGICGTPEFMSPEQALGEEVDARSDLYSLGATAFYALSGRVPFEGRTSAEVLAQQVSAAAPALGAIGIAVPRRLALLVDRCLAKHPAERPPSAESLAEQLGVAIEQRRELPAALRAFVKRTGRMDGGGTVLALIGALAAGVGTSATVNLASGAAVFCGLALVTPIAFSVRAARTLLSLGFAQADLAPAFKAELESSREERHVQPRAARALCERLLRHSARVAGTSAALLVPLVPLQGSGAAAENIGMLLAICLSVAAAATFGVLALRQDVRDVDVEFWGRVWTGRFGAWAFATARRLRGNAPAVQAMTHRATELSLGIAAEDLFNALPASTRASLGDVPAVLGRLQRDATRLRAQLEQLPDDALQQRLQDTVAALETMRLNLLRLHAGVLSLERFTTQFDEASRIGDDIDRLVEAHADVATVLHGSTPRLALALEPTPV